METNGYGGEVMIIILCPTYEEAVNAYFEFIGVICCCGCWASIKRKYDEGLLVELDDDLTYIFMEENWQKIVDQRLEGPADYDYMESFFQDLYVDDVDSYVPWCED